MTAVESAWCRETSADPDGWAENNPAWGQCAVTALLVQDLFGGVIWRAELDTGSHYFNDLRGAQMVDLTGQQFGPNWKADLAGRDWFSDELRTRAELLAHPDTARRYELLRSRFIRAASQPSEVA